LKPDPVTIRAAVELATNDHARLTIIGIKATLLQPLDVVDVSLLEWDVQLRGALASVLAATVPPDMPFDWRLCRRTDVRGLTIELAGPGPSAAYVSGFSTRLLLAGWRSLTRRETEIAMLHAKPSRMAGWRSKSTRRSTASLGGCAVQPAPPHDL
jgi:hypothetical protein